MVNHIPGYVLTNEMAHDAPSNPLYKKVGLQMGAWIMNFALYPVFRIAPICGFLGAILAIFLFRCALVKSLG